MLNSNTTKTSLARPENGLADLSTRASTLKNYQPTKNLKKNLNRTREVTEKGLHNSDSKYLMQVVWEGRVST